METTTTPPRYYVAAVGFGWGVYDRQDPPDADPTGPHVRVEYYAPTFEGVDFAGCHEIAKTECERRNAEATAPPA
jgi:hypothetical protein